MLTWSSTTHILCDHRRLCGGLSCAGLISCEWILRASRQGSGLLLICYSHMPPQPAHHMPHAPYVHSSTPPGLLTTHSLFTFLLGRCLDHNPRARPSAYQVHRELASLLAQLGQGYPVLSEPDPDPLPTGHPDPASCSSPASDSMLAPGSVMLPTYALQPGASALHHHQVTQQERPGCATASVGAGPGDAAAAAPAAARSSGPGAGPAAAAATAATATSRGAGGAEAGMQAASGQQVPALGAGNTLRPGQRVASPASGISLMRDAAQRVSLGPGHPAALYQTQASSIASIAAQSTGQVSSTDGAAAAAGTVVSATPTPTPTTMFSVGSSEAAASVVVPSLPASASTVLVAGPSVPAPPSEFALRGTRFASTGGACRAPGSQGRNL